MASDWALYAVTFCNIGTVINYILLSVTPRAHQVHWLVRIVLTIAVIGSAGQAVRNIEYFQTGISPTDAYWPVWMPKDYGIFGWSLALLLLSWGVVDSRLTKEGDHDAKKDQNK